ncbi:MAG: BatA domain-containing protein, partial [Phycisphaerae bacterium]
MLSLGPLAFGAPWVLLGLAVLPVIWWLLRVTPPAPRRVAFPAVRLLLGLPQGEETPARTPLWLLALRMLIAALVILALADPYLNPQIANQKKSAIVIVVDNGWA